LLFALENGLAASFRNQEKIMALPGEKCKPCNVIGTPLTATEAGELAPSVPLWTQSEKQIEREFKFKDFREAMAFVNQVADVANEQDHHPDIRILYSRVQLKLSTHKIGGLSQNDFILAAKIDRLADDAFRL
jgi:4a-hydroxytetrahydrobiopterin dehydratase